MTTRSLQLGDKIGKATIIEFCEEPNTGLAIIEQERTPSKQCLNCEGTGVVVVPFSPGHPYQNEETCPACDGDKVIAGTSIRFIVPVWLLERAA